MDRRREPLMVADILKLTRLGLSVSEWVRENLNSSIVAKEAVWDAYDKMCRSLKERIRPIVLEEIRQQLREPPGALEDAVQQEVDYRIYDVIDTSVAGAWTKNPRSAHWEVKAKLSMSEETYDIAFHPNGWLLASAGRNACQIWDIYAEKRLATIPDGSGTSSVAFSPDGALLAVGGDGVIQLRDKYGRNSLGPLAGHRAWVNCLVFGAGSTRLVSGDDVGNVMVWDVPQRRVVQSFELPRRPVSKEPDSVRALAISPDGALVAVGGAVGALELWDIGGRSVRAKIFGGPVRKYTDHARAINGVAFSASGDLLCSIDGCGAYRSRSLSSKMDFEILGHSPSTPFDWPSTALTMGPFNSIVAASWTETDRNQLLFVDPTTGSTLAKVPHPSHRCTRLAFSPNGRYLAALDDDHLDLLQLKT